jgi:hypothetical protein
MHRFVGERLRAEPELLERVRARVRGWLRDGSVHPHYARRWAEALAGPLEDLVALLADPGEEACALRQASPFAGLIDNRTRWRIWREVRESSEAER